MDEDATDKAVDLLIIHHIRRGTGKSRWRHNLRAYLSWHGRRDESARARMMKRGELRLMARSCRGYCASYTPINTNSPSTAPGSTDWV